MLTTSQQSALSREDATALLRDHDIQPTQQRVEVAQVLFAGPQHMSAEQVLALVNERGQAISKATVYNTLGLFVEKRLAREVIVDPNRVFYDSNTAPHHHFYNVDTGTLTDIDASEVDIGALPRLPEGTEPAGVDVIIRVREPGHPGD